MISPIPNQPVDFIGSSLLVGCPDKRLPLLASLGDTIRFQVAIDPPTGAYAYGDALRVWDVVFDWGGPGSWVQYPTAQCATEPAAGGYIQPILNLFYPALGAAYLVEVDVQSISGTCTFSMGDQDVVLSAPGLQTFTIIAAGTSTPRITLDNDDSRICVAGVSLYQFLAGDEGCETLVELVDVESGLTISDFNSGTSPELFTLSGGVLGVSAPLFNVEEGQCIFIRIAHTCDIGGDVLCSQPIKVDGDCNGTVKIRACLDSDAMGFAAPAVFDVRLKASLIRPKWQHDSSEERWSDGTINRYFVDRQRTVDLSIQLVDEVLHPFLAALCMFDHVYINDDEYVVDAGAYEPAYGEQTGTAAAQLTVRPKRELVRRVTCDEVGPGCPPSSDPLCAAPNVRIVLTYDADEGGRMLRVTIYSAIGFAPENLTVYADGVEVGTEVWISPTDFIFGPIAMDVPIEVHISNRYEPSCDWVWVCEAPTVSTTQAIIGEQLYLQVDLRALLGYSFTGIYAVVNGVQGAFTPYPSPQIALLGPYEEGDSVVVAVLTEQPNGCAYMVGPIEIGGDPAFSSGGLNDEVFDLRYSFGGILVAGNFTLYDTTPANRFTKLQANGLLDTDFNTNLGGGFDVGVRGFDLYADGSSVVVGAFSTIDGVSSPKIAKIGVDGTPDPTFVVGTGLNGTIATDVAVLSSGSCVATGNFTTFNGTAAPGIVGLLPTGAIDSSFAYGVGFNSQTGLCVYDPTTDTILVSGNFFTTYQGVTVRTGTATIVRINADGTYNSTLALATDGTNPQFNAGIRGMTVLADGRVVVTGNFTIYDGAAVGHIAVLNPDGTLDAAFMSGMGTAFSDWTTRSSVQDDGKILVGIYNAPTTTFDGVDANGMVRLEVDGTRDFSFNSGTGFDGRTGPSDSNGALNYVGGNFLALNSAARAKVARLPFP